MSRCEYQELDSEKKTFRRCTEGATTTLQVKFKLHEENFMRKLCSKHAIVFCAALLDDAGVVNFSLTITTEGEQATC